ncbi:phosphotransferase [Rugosimonospora acidiphila]|uniref:phosphotransferase n=1 Tax=Rugosimonospora acidiphila TaxID=556531 RepID=UPI0031EC7E40
MPGWLGLVAGGRVAVGGDKLRHWGISETWRIRWAAGPTTIVKRCAGEEALTLDVYEELLIPCRISAPRLLAAHRGDGFVVLMFEDLGRVSLADQPSIDGFIASARMLARLRHNAQGRVATVDRFRFATAEITDAWARATTGLTAVRPDLVNTLRRCEPLLAPNLRRLAETVPDTIVHGDFESKNIVLTDTGPGAIDWATGRVGAHLGDLYSLIRDAGLVGEPPDGIVAGYADECALIGTPVTDLEWQLALGGLVWTLRALRWVLEEGIHVVPAAITWLDELVQRAGNVTDNLARLSGTAAPLDA